MMRNLKLYIPIIILLSACLASCKETHEFSGELSAFISQDDIGLYIAEQKVFRYDSTTCQIMKNEKRKIFRMQRDDYSQLVNAEFSTFDFSQDQECLISVDYLSNKSISHYNLKTNLVQIESGKLWFWDADKKIGCVIPMGY